MAAQGLQLAAQLKASTSLMLFEQVWALVFVKFVGFWRRIVAFSMTVATCALRPYSSSSRRNSCTSCTSCSSLVSIFATSSQQVLAVHLQLELAEGVLPPSIRYLQCKPAAVALALQLAESRARLQVFCRCAWYLALRDFSFLRLFARGICAPGRRDLRRSEPTLRLRAAGSGPAAGGGQFRGTGPSRSSQREQCLTLAR